MKSPSGFALALDVHMPDSCFIGADPVHHDGFCREEFSSVWDCEGVISIFRSWQDYTN